MEAMNLSHIGLELAVAVLAIGILLGDLWTPAPQKRALGYVGAAALGLLFTFSLFQYGAHLVQHSGGSTADVFAFGGLYILDDLAFFLKHLFIIAAVLVLLISAEFSDRIEAGISEFYSVTLFALCGMLFAASSNDFVMVFVSLELITISFYVLNSFQRNRTESLEAGVKYLVLSALATAFTVFGIALVFGTTGTTAFSQIHAQLVADLALRVNGVFLLGLAFIAVGIGFKIAAFPLQIWAPDVYQGAPVPATCFLAVGSKAAGMVLLMRIVFSVVPQVVIEWTRLLAVVSAATILYGNLCAIPQRSLKRLLGYSSIANAGYMLLGFAAFSTAGASAILYYLAGYIFTVVAAFLVVCLVTRNTGSDDISVLAGLSKRSPLLAVGMTLSMVSLAGIPPLAGFFGKFLLLKAVVERSAVDAALYWLVVIAIIGVIISIYYYFGVIRTIYWSREAADLSPVAVSVEAKAALLICIAAMLYLGVLPEAALRQVNQIAATLRSAPVISAAVAK